MTVSEGPKDAVAGSGPSSFQGVVARTWRENRLFSALLELTYRCNLDCFFCYNDLSLKGRPMATPEWLSLMEGLAHLGTLNLTLSGGEPLAHPDFMLIGRSARDLGFVVRVKSNGHALGEALAERLKREVDPYVVETSLHGASAPTHDRQTRVQGSFDRLLKNVRAMKGAGLRVQVNTTLTAWNEGEIDGMVALAEELGVRLQFDPEVTPRDNGDTEPLKIRASREGILRLFRLGERGGAGEPLDLAPRAPGEVPGKHCGAGSSGIAVDPYGNVYPCVQWRHAVGNLHQSSIEEIWHGSKELDAVRRVSSEVKRVVDASEDGRLMSFCPGTAARVTGSPLVVYEGAARRAELARLSLRVLPNDE